MANAAYKPRLQSLYEDQIKKALQEEFSYKNVMQIPCLEKVVINMGVGEATADRKKLTNAHPITQFKGGNRFFGFGDHRLLAGNIP